MSLTQVNRLKDLGMESRELPVHQSLPRASVLVPLFVRENETLHVLLTQRPQHMSSHAGDVCFPGGRQDPEDEGDDVLTAMREAYEEVGLRKSSIQPLCRLVSLESRNGLCVTPIVAILDPPNVVDQLTLNADEVETAFTLPLEYFLEQNGNLYDKFDVPWSGGTFTLRTYMYEEGDKSFKIWGLTAHILHQVARIALEGCMEGTTVNDQTPSSSTSNTISIEGNLWFWKEMHWSENYYVLSGGMLHQYTSKGQADAKAASATKKNRLPLSGAKTTKSTTTDDNSARCAFEISAVGGRVKWILAAESERERDKWMNILKFSAK